MSEILCQTYLPGDRCMTKHGHTSTCIILTLTIAASSVKAALGLVLHFFESYTVTSDKIVI